MAISDLRLLAHRIEKLTGAPAESCVRTYRSEADELGLELGFRIALRRFRTLGDRHRLLALSLLKRRGELCACEIQAALGISHPAVSHQMEILVRTRLVKRERRGKWMHYRLAPRIADILP